MYMHMHMSVAMDFLAGKAYKWQYGSRHEDSSIQVLFFKCYFLLKQPQYPREMVISGLELRKYKLSPEHTDVLVFSICQQREEGSARYA